MKSKLLIFFFLVIALANVKAQETGPVEIEEWEVKLAWQPRTNDASQILKVGGNVQIIKAFGMATGIVETNLAGKIGCTGLESLVQGTTLECRTKYIDVDSTEYSATLIFGTSDSICRAKGKKYCEDNGISNCSCVQLIFPPGPESETGTGGN